MITSDNYCLTCGAANRAEAEVCFACGTSMKITVPLSPVSSAKLVGQPLLKQRYRILAQVGNGGFSVVYKAEDTRDGNREVAIKAITLHGLQPQEIIEATEAFNREILILSDLKHRNLPRIRDHFSDTRCWYLVMDYIEGTSLEKHLENMPGGRLPLEEVLDIGVLLCDVLDYLHGCTPSVIFRDLKPANIILTVDGHLALIDFGIARRFKPGQQKDTMVFGSPGYAAPEQYGKAQTTPRADIYSLGALLHQLLTGDDPSQNAFRFASLEARGDDALLRLNILIIRMVEMDEKLRPESIAVIEKELRSIGDEHMLRQVKGLPPTTAPLYFAKTASWQTSGLPRTQGSAATSAGSKAQIAMMQQQRQQQSSGTSNPYYIPSASSTPTAAPQQGNGMATASMLFGLLTFLMPLFVCTLGSSLISSSLYTEMFISTLLLILLVPALLAISFGHLALNHSKRNLQIQVRTGMAITGLILGYGFGSLYVMFLLCDISSRIGWP
ncbi:MAG TPA: serine/threonine-protein kinase [Ktedonobacteraceae bacterium]|nr:serine/threonine-protein kinase [Ktedonobacteraceae bacterium]